MPLLFNLHYICYDTTIAMNYKNPKKKKTHLLFFLSHIQAIWWYDDLLYDAPGALGLKGIIKKLQKYWISGFKNEIKYSKYSLFKKVFFLFDCISISLFAVLFLFSYH